MKKPKIRPSVLADMTVVRYTPRIAPGVVATANRAPVLYDIRFCLENIKVAARAVKTITVWLVPAALAGEKAKKRVSRGTMKTPPPIPVKAATIPIKKPRNGSSISHTSFTSVHAI
jgi:hypothetical protein